MIKSVKASRSHSKETRKGCRKIDRTIGGDGEGQSETISQPLKYGYVSILGRKRVMEDPVMVVPPRKLPGGYSFFAAYGGGRGGANVAEMCTDKLHQCLEKHTETAAKLPEEKGIQWGKLLMDCFSCMYEDMCGKEVEQREGMSSAAAAAERMMKFTAVVVGVEKGEVVLVNCGGSRAVLWSGGVASPLWNYHNKPYEADDESIRAAGGTIISSDDDGLVSTSRSQGDGCEKHERIWEAAEVTVLRRNENSEDFLIIASDGLWNVMGKEMACEVVRKCLDGKIRSFPSEGGGASQAAAMLAELAIAKGSKDNISIIVVHLN